MRKLIWGGVALAALWSGYWAAGTYAIRAGVMQGVSSTRGLTVPEVTMRGFPGHFDLGLGAFAFADPASGIGWQSPGLRVQAATWRPWHVDVWPSLTQTISVPGQTLTLTAADLGAALTVFPRRSLDLQAVTVRVVQPVVVSSLGWGGSGDLATLSVTATPDRAGTYDFAVLAETLRPDAALAALLGTDIPVSRLTLGGNATFTQPLGPKVDPETLRLMAISIGDMQLIWGDVQGDVAGGVVANADGFAEGRFDVVITNWRSLIPALVTAGAIPADAAPTITGFLNAVAAQGGDPEVLNLPLIFANGRGTLGPLPLGPAPRLNEARAVPAG
jgi:hypothetical protein